MISKKYLIVFLALFSSSAGSLIGLVDVGGIPAYCPFHWKSHKNPTALLSAADCLEKEGLVNIESLSNQGYLSFNWIGTPYYPSELMSAEYTKKHADALCKLALDYLHVIQEVSTCYNVGIEQHKSVFKPIYPFLVDLLDELNNLYSQTEGTSWDNLQEDERKVQIDALRAKLDKIYPKLMAASFFIQEKTKAVQANPSLK